MIWLKAFNFFRKYWQIIAIVIIILALFGFGYYVKSVMAENDALKIEVQERKKDIENLENKVNTILNSVNEQEKNLQEYSKKLTQYQTESKEAMQVFAKHNLQNLSEKKPGLIEKRVNKATSNVFLVMQQDTEHFYQEVTK